MRSIWMAIAASAVLFNAGAVRAHFLQTDPVGYKDDMDLYAYVGDDPLDRGDPTGLAGQGNLTDQQWAVVREKQAEALGDVRSTRAAIHRIEGAQAAGQKLSAGDAKIAAAIAKTFGSSSNGSLQRVDAMYGHVESVLADTGSHFNYHSPSAAEVRDAGVKSTTVAYTHQGSNLINILPSYYHEPSWHMEGTLIHEPTHIYGTQDFSYRAPGNQALARDGWASFWGMPYGNADSYASTIVGH